MVVMAQDFKERYPLVDIFGNVGSIDGDPAAAMRYTEGRLSKFGDLMLKDIDKDTVDFTPNYDESELEPVILPSLFPNLLLNGTQGIAVGMNASFLPHCAKDIYKVFDKIIDNYLKDKDTSIDKIIEMIGAPDFPTGGVIVNHADVIKAYKEGHGRCLVRAKYQFEKYGRRKDRDSIVITEIPYGVNKAKLVYRIGMLASEDSDFADINNVRDESDRTGMRIVIELKKDAQTNIVVNRLLKKTDLQKSQSIHMNALVDGKPVIDMTIKDVIKHFLKHAVTVLERKVKYERDKYSTRMHIITAIVKVLEDVDKAIKLMKTSSRQEARNNLVAAYGFDDVQVNAIENLKFYALNEEDKNKYLEEYKSIDTELKRCNNILNSKTELLKYVQSELKNVANTYFKKDARLTEISNETDDRDTIPDMDVVIAYTNNGYIKSVKLDEYNTQKRNGKGVSFKTKEDDFVKSINTLSTHDDLVLITSSGKGYVLPAYKIPTVSKSSIGKPITNYVNMNTGDEIVAVIPVTNGIDRETTSLIFLTQNGLGKRMSIEQLPKKSQGAKIIKMDDSDRLMSCFLAKDGDNILMTTADGYSTLITLSDDIRSMGRLSGGIRFMKFKNDQDYLVSACTVTSDDNVFIVSSKGFAKKLDVEETLTPRKNRGGKGITTYKTSITTGKVRMTAPVNDNESIIVVTQKGMIIRVSASQITTTKSRTARGVRLIKLDQDDIIATISVASEEKRGNLEDESSES